MKKEWLLKKDNTNTTSCKNCELAEWCATGKTFIDFKKITGTVCEFNRFFIFLPTATLKKRRF